MAHIVILGAGIGGIPMAYELRHKIRRRKDVITVISDKPYFQFTPSNPWLAVGWRTPDKTTIELAPVFKKLGINFISEAVYAVYPGHNTIELASGHHITYDCLVIATGPALAFDEIEGFGPYAHTQSICCAHHAVAAREKWEEFVRDPGPIIVGAVPGASCFGPAYEFAAIMDTDLKRREIRYKVPMTFVTSEPYIGHLGLGGVGNTKGMLEAEFRDRHIQWIANASVERIEAGKMYVNEHNEMGQLTRQHELPFKYSMMMPAFRGIEALQHIHGLVNERGFVIVDEYQRNPTYQNIFAVGVCIAIPPLEQTPIPTNVPKTGYMIESMVTATAENIANMLHGREPAHRPTWNAFCLADMGNKGIAFIAIPQNPPRNTNWASGGKWVHLAKIAFEKYFLRKVRKGQAVPFYEKSVLALIRLHKLKKK